MSKPDSRTTTTFTISGIPTKEFERFLKYCEENSTVTKIFDEEGRRKIKHQQWYAGAIKMLLDTAQKDAAMVTLYDELVKQRKKIEELEKKINAIIQK